MSDITISEALQAAYRWADTNAAIILAAAVVVPLVATGAALVGRGGRTDKDGKLLASVFIGLGIFIASLELVSIWFAHSVLGASVLNANALLVLAPAVYLAATMAGIRQVFPLNQLASVRAATDIGLFLGAGLGVIWIFSMFRGWGVLFLGGTGQLVLLAALGWVLVRRLYRRAFSRRRE